MLINNDLLGSTIALCGCRAWAGANEQTNISGLFVVEEFLYADPAAYIHTPGYLIYEVGEHDNEDAPDYFVDAYDLWEQTDPKGYGEFLASERQYELMQEDEGE